MAYPPPPSPAGPFLDVHDLATWILHAHATVAGAPFATSTIAEVSKNGAPLKSLCQAPEEWTNATGPPRRVAYVLGGAPHGTPETTIDTFVSSRDGVFTPNDHALSRRELEDIFWRCKDFNQGSQLAYVAQCVFDTLTQTGVWLRARTSTGYQLAFNPTEIRVGTAMVTPREGCVIIDRVAGQVHSSGLDGPVPWPYLVLGSDADIDRRVVLDLAIPHIGGRGLGGEIFALERHDDYMTRVLPLYAQVYSVKDLTMGMVPFSADEYTKTRAKFLTVAIMDRITASVRTEDFCRHCGEPGVIPHCTYCPANFCEPCYELGWKYHQRWCVPFRG